MPALVPGQQSELKVLLIAMPWGVVYAPSLGLATLKAILERDGIACDVYNLNCTFARQIGVNLYGHVSFASGGDFRGESFFTPSYFDLDPSEFLASLWRPHYEKIYLHLTETWGYSGEFPARAFLDRCEQLIAVDVPTFIARCVKEIDWSRYDIIGFSLMFSQTLPSLCLARWIKDHHPEKTVIFGGPSCDGEMGLEMLRSFSPIDIVAIGEADRTVTPLVHAIRGRHLLSEIPGIAYRQDGQIVQTQPAPLLTDLDWLPIPDFSDYFERIGGSEDFGTKIFFESSRGCWWGQKVLCSFCGENANGLQFRCKSPERVIQEILTIEARHGVSYFFATDTILNMSYFQTVLPDLRKVNQQRAPSNRISVFYEVKSNMRKDQMSLMVEAGIHEVQPGIESFSDGILERMRKGATGVQQIQFVKWATEFGLKSYYGILHSSPNDTPEDYREMQQQVEYLKHLPPPTYVTPTILDRFSAFWLSPEAFGISRIRASASYKLSFPDDRIDHDRLAYQFEYDHADQRNQELAEAMSSCLAEIRSWRQAYKPDTLIYDEIDSDVWILDRRDGRSDLEQLRGWQARVFLFCDRYTTLPLMVRHHPAVSEAEIEEFLGVLTEKRWVYRDRKGRCLSLPIKRDVQAILGVREISLCTASGEALV